MYIPKKLRMEILEETQYTCSMCKESYPGGRFLHIHHLTQEGGNNRSNLVVLCTSCHTKVHVAMRRSGVESYSGYHIVMDLTKEEEIGLKLAALEADMTIKQWMAEAIKEKLNKEG